MRLPALILLALPALFPAGASAQPTLNKCIDAEGRITYSNLPCRGAREVKKVEIDPPPPPPPRPQPAPVPLPAAPVITPVPAPQPAATQQTAAPAVPAPAPVPAPVPAPAPTRAPAPAQLPAAAPPQAVPIAPTPVAPAAPRAEIQRTGKPVVAPRSCDTLTDQLGRVLDQMDAGQRKGVTQQQMDAWKRDIQNLERKKQEAGCF